MELKKIGELAGGWWRYNFDSKIRVLAPRSVMISLTYWCNSRCVMCNIWQIRPKKELSYEDWKKMMTDPIFADIRSLIITGGEPSMYRDFVKTIKLFVKSMPKLRRMVINSNGFTPKKLAADMEEIAGYCQRKRVKLTANVSIDGVGMVHDKLRRIENGFDKCVETVEGYKKLIPKYGINVGVSSLILKQNVDDVETMMKWLKETKTNGSFQIVGFHDTYLRNAKTENELGIDESVRNKFIKLLAKIRDNTGWPYVSKYYWDDMINMYANGGKRTTPCSFLKDDFVVDSFGDVYYCLSVRAIGNILKEQRTVGEIYFDSKNINFRKNLPKSACKSCNSGCNVTNAIAYDAKRWWWYKITGKLWPGKMLDKS